MWPDAKVVVYKLIGATTIKLWIIGMCACVCVYLDVCLHGKFWPHSLAQDITVQTAGKSYERNSRNLQNSWLVF